MKTLGKVMLTVAASASMSLAMAAQAVSTAQAASPRPVQGTCTAKPDAVSRVVDRAGPATRSSGCCDGRMRCSQFLATTTVVRPLVNHRT